ncbi:MAG: DMT family transporter [Desulfobacula sp.]|jgi:drug/metabolite transporter (DMT)-like permease
MNILKKYRILARLAETHHHVPEVHNETRHHGIILTVVGFFILSFYTVIFEFEVNKFHLKVSSSLCNVFLQFSALYLGMLLFFLTFCLSQGVKYFKCKEPRLLAYRTIFAIVGFWLYSLARVWTTTIDNSLLYSTDAIWLVILLYLIGIKVRPVGILGILIGLSGIITVYVVVYRSVYDLIGAFFGTVSGFTLAVITIITSYLVKQDPPLRIGLYQSALGLASSLLIAFFAGIFQGWGVPSNIELFNMFFAGIIFASAMYCLWQALFYAESYIIGAASYLFPIFVLVLSWILNDDAMNFFTIVGTIIISIGTLLVIIDSMHNKNDSRKSYADSKRER